MPVRGQLALLNPQVRWALDGDDEIDIVMTLRNNLSDYCVWICKRKPPAPGNNCLRQTQDSWHFRNIQQLWILESAWRRCSTDKIRHFAWILKLEDYSDWFSLEDSRKFPILALETMASFRFGSETCSWISVISSLNLKIMETWFWIFRRPLKKRKVYNQRFQQ